MAFASFPELSRVPGFLVIRVTVGHVLFLFTFAILLQNDYLFSAF